MYGMALGREMPQNHSPAASPRSTAAVKEFKALPTQRILSSSSTLEASVLGEVRRLHSPRTEIGSTSSLSSAGHSSTSQHIERSVYKPASSMGPGCLQLSSVVPLQGMTPLCRKLCIQFCKGKCLYILGGSGPRFSKGPVTSRRLRSSALGLCLSGLTNSNTVPGAPFSTRGSSESPGELAQKQTAGPHSWSFCFGLLLCQLR